MEANEFQKLTVQSETYLNEDRVHDCSRILQGLLGLNGEAGECLEILKKHLYQEHWFDQVHLAKELGDVAYYLALSADAIGYTLEEIFQMNIDKRMSRYPNGFDAEHSKHRKDGDV